ncbi:MAG: hypothetical protein JXL80_09200 [Planctomycetes bacterium]|nr:hypothetical protein [Planctomycetota bacterium]
MGLGFLVKADVPGRGLLRRRPSQNALFSEICAAIRSLTSDPLMARMFITHTDEHTLSVTLHPCAEPVEFLWQPDQTIEVSAKTSTVGPGYHAHVVDLLNRVGSELSLRWDWAEEGADETGFANSDNFDALQREMATFLKALGDVPLEQSGKGHTNLMLNMACGYPAPEMDSFVISPLGPLSEDWCRELTHAGGETLAQMCREYYPWWERAPDAVCWRSIGLYLMWCEVRWHVPTEERERATCQLALDCMERAASQDAGIQLPTSEIQELRRLLTWPKDAPPQLPEPQGIGYRRRNMIHALTGGWTIRLPGYYYETWEDDGAMAVFWFGGRTVRFTSFTMTSKDGQPASPRSMLSEKTPEKLQGAEVVDLDNQHLQGWATIRPAEEDGQPLVPFRRWPAGTRT